MESVLKYIVVILFLLIFLNPLILSFVGLIDWRLLLEYIKTLIWPLIALIFLFNFRSRIGNFLDRLTNITGPGGFGASAESPRAQTEEPPPDDLVTQAISNLNERVILAEGRATELERKTNELLIQLHFERVYRLIFGSQIGLLQYLEILGEKGLTKFEIGELYKNNPISTTYSLENYIGFLLNNQLIQINPVNTTHQITPVGKFFLDYLIKNQIPTNKPY